MKRLKKGTPGKGGESPRDSFSNTPVGHGLKNYWTGWLAGEPYWALSHEHKPPHQLGTKPCLKWLTDEALPCARCRPKVLATWIGWVPIYREVDHEPCIVIVHESVMDVVAELRYGTRVLVGRMAETASIFVRRAEVQTPVWKSTHEQRQGPRDITPDLLTMWGIPILDSWLRESGPASDTALSLDKSTSAAPGLRQYVPPGEGSADQRLTDYPALAKRLTGDNADVPSTNGRHDKE